MLTDMMISHCFHSFIDVAGVVVRDGGLDFFKHQDQEVPVREVMLADPSSPGVKVKIWGTEAENLDCSSKPVLVIKDIKVRSSRGSSYYTVFYSNCGKQNIPCNNLLHVCANRFPYI